jgi:hypothetical protein
MFRGASNHSRGSSTAVANATGSLPPLAGGWGEG